MSAMWIPWRIGGEEERVEEGRGTVGGKGMPIRVNLRDAETGSRIEMDLEHENTVEDAIESAASFWDKQAGAFVIRHGNKILRGRTTMTELGIREGDLLELIPDPEGGGKNKM